MDSTIGPTAAATGREHLGTVLFGLWTTVGLFTDGWFHQNLRGEAESFFTPWHALFYAGFAASALWLLRMSRRRGAGWAMRRLPPGYEGARLGLVLFAAGGVGDAMWHSRYGVERGIDALLSPTHLLLLVGLLLILTAPARAAGAGPWAVVASVTCATALVGFFLNFAWGLGIAALTRAPYDAVTETGETQVIAGVGSMLVTTAVLFGSARLLLARGRAPFGACAVLIGVVSLLVSTAFDEDIEGVVAALVAGVVLDLLLRARVRQATSFGLASAVLWVAYFGLLIGLDDIAWSAEIWLGAVVLNTMAASAIAVHDTPSVPALGALVS